MKYQHGKNENCKCFSTCGGRNLRRKNKFHISTKATLIKHCSFQVVTSRNYIKSAGIIFWSKS